MNNVPVEHGIILDNVLCHSTHYFSTKTGTKLNTCTLAILLYILSFELKSIFSITLDIPALSLALRFKARSL